MPLKSRHYGRRSASARRRGTSPRSTRRRVGQAPAGGGRGRIAGTRACAPPSPRTRTLARLRAHAALGAGQGTPSDCPKGAAAAPMTPWLPPVVWSCGGRHGERSPSPRQPNRSPALAVTRPAQSRSPVGAVVGGEAGRLWGGPQRPSTNDPVRSGRPCRPRRRRAAAALCGRGTCRGERCACVFVLVLFGEAATVQGNAHRLRGYNMRA